MRNNLIVGDLRSQQKWLGNINRSVHAKPQGCWANWIQ
jgi:hypothetical protein